MMTRRCAVLLTLALSSGVAARAGDGPIQIVSRAIVDPRTGSAQAGRVVVIEAGRIREVRQGTPVAGIPILDLSTAYLLPGLYDVHTHLCSRIDAGGRTYQIERGKIAEQWVFPDALSLQRQLTSEASGKP